jgi:chromatin remodeling complex protein RSC6
MQNYQRYAQAQARTPGNSRRPGECDSSTYIPSQPRLLAPGLNRAIWKPGPSTALPNFQLSPVSPISPALSNSKAKRHRSPSKGSPSPRKKGARKPLLATSGNVTTRGRPPTNVQYSLSSNGFAGVPRNLWPSLIHVHNQARVYHTRMNIGLPAFRDIGIPPNPTVAAQQHQQQLYQQQMAQRNAALEHQLAQRRARKPTDREMPDDVEELIIGDGVQQYKKLRESEKKLDYTIMRKRLDIQDTLNRNVRRQRTMRVWITNTCENQPWQRPDLDENSFDFESGADATWRVKVVGKLLDEVDETASDDEDEMEIEDGTENGVVKPEKQKAEPKKFSHHFKAVSVEYDKARNMPNAHIDPSLQVEWKKTPQSAEFDCFEFQRKGDENQNITISLVRDEPVERYRLSQALSNALDMEEADRAEVVMGIWEYVKATGLQEDEERRYVRCDDRLRSVRQIHSVFHVLRTELLTQVDLQRRCLPLPSSG